MKAHEYFSVLHNSLGVAVAIAATVNKYRLRRDVVEGWVKVEDEKAEDVK